MVEGDPAQAEGCAALLNESSLSVKTLNLFVEPDTSQELRAAAFDVDSVENLQGISFHENFYQLTSTGRPGKPVLDRQGSGVPRDFVSRVTVAAAAAHKHLSDTLRTFTAELSP